MLRLPARGPDRRTGGMRARTCAKTRSDVLMHHIYTHESNTPRWSGEPEDQARVM